MRIIHIISSLDPKAGGVSQALRTIIKGLTELKVHNEVACLDAPDADYLMKENFPVYALGPGRTSWNYNVSILKWLKLNMRNYTVVIVHGLWQYPMYATYNVWKNLTNGKPRLFVMPHGMLDPYFQRAENRKLKALRNLAYWKLVEQKVINNADGLLFTCEEEQKLAMQPFKPYAPRNEHIVGLGVEEPPPYKPEMNTAFADTCRQLQNNSYILFLSRIHDKKGVDLLINAYADFCERITAKKSHYPDNGILSLSEIPRLVIAGPNLESPFGQQMQKAVSQNPVLKERVFFTGMLSGNAKWGAFYGCKAFILPSHQENFGIAVVEALACSKPVLISNQVNIWREISNNGAGLIAEDTVQGTEELLVKWCRSSEKQQTDFQTSARQLYLNHFSVKRAAECLLKALQL